MLDLNLNADSATGSVDMPPVPLSASQMESSGSFNSSVANADTEDSCSYGGDAVHYNFAILKNAGGGNGSPGTGAGDYGCVRTIQLFPVDGVVERLHGSSSGSKGWLDFAAKEVDHGGGGVAAEQRIVPQRPQQVKKSRRGPRSRSSQYRGVTFYRRTGRWESHIWLAINDSVHCVV